MKTGLLPEAPKPLDSVMGGESRVKHEKRLNDSDWTKYLPTEERQSKRSGSIALETMSCTSFSLNNSLETQLNWMSLPETHLKFLSDNGYLEQGKANFSDRFLAVISGTTQEGNYFSRVADTARHNGLIPESRHPFGGSSFGEYHNSNLITNDMRSLGKEFLKYFDITYEWVFTTNVFNQETASICKTALEHAPLQVGIPIPADHAILLYRISDNAQLFDTYEPFKKDRKFQEGIHFGLKAVINVRREEEKPVMPNYTFLLTLIKGQRNNEVKMLQTVLKVLGIFKAEPTGYFGDITEQAVKTFQVKHGIEAIGRVGPKTRAALNKLTSQS